MTDLDRAAALGGVVFLVGAFTIWWQAAIMLTGACIVAGAVLLAYLRRKGAAATERHDG